MKSAIKKVVPEPVLRHLRRPPPKKTFYEWVSGLGSDSENEWIRKSSTIGGWLFEDEHEFLWDLACRSKEGDIAEIGTWMGKSACILAGACCEHSPDTRVICIDPFDMSGTEEQAEYHRTLVPEAGTFYYFLSNATRLGFVDHVVPIAALSHKAIRLVPDALRMVFVDGAHDYEGCKADVDLMFPKLRVGGVLALHDARNLAWPELGDYVDRELIPRADLKVIDTVTSIVAFEKVQA